jgi:hypothetical protein
MKIANRWTDSVDDDEFEDSEVEVDSCDSYPDEVNTDYMETIYRQDEALDADKYIEQFEAQDPEEVARGGWDMTNQLELELEGLLW